MINSLKINVKRDRLILSLIGVWCLVWALPLLKLYLKPSFTWCMYLVLVVGCINIVQKNQRSYRFGIIATICLALFLLMKVKVLFLSGLLFTMLFLLELGVGRLNQVPIYGIFLLTPLSQYVFNTFSFPIRLSLTKWTADVLRFIDPTVKAFGNVIEYHKLDFTVDEVCMGLNFFHIGFLTTLVVIAFLERKRKKFMPWWQIGIWLLLTSILVVAANFARILLIVLFQALPGGFEHEFIGLCCFAFYVLLPVLFAIKWKVNLVTPSRILKKNLPLNLVLPLVLLVFFTIVGIKPSSFLRQPAKATFSEQEIEGYQSKLFADNIVQFYNDTTLVYVKPGVPFYAAEHSARVCWRGSGYRIVYEKPERIDGHPVVLTELEAPNGDRLKSAWWFTNGEMQTTSQWVWRKAMINGSPPFQLINVVATSDELLEQEVRKWSHLLAKH